MTVGENIRKIKPERNLTQKQEVLTNSNFDGIKAMRRLFHVFRLMDIYSESETFDLNLKIQKMYDEALNEIGLNSQNNI